HLAALRNQTAAAVSMHFGIPLLMAVAALWIRPRAPLSWLMVVYPAAVFFVILGTGNHYVLDALVGVGVRRYRRRSRLPRAPAAARPRAGRANAQSRARRDRLRPRRVRPERPRDPGARVAASTAWKPGPTGRSCRPRPRRRRRSRPQAPRARSGRREA